MNESGSRSRDDGRVAGSFRDPSGYVFHREGRLFRAIDEPCNRVLAGLAEAGVLAELANGSKVVRSDFVTDPALVAALSAEHPGFSHFLEHQVVWPITYPYEWSLSMLADAGLLTIDLQLRLLQAGCGLKDASAYNVQFVGGRPVFIDLASIESPRRMDLWYALGQFQQMFLFPLLLCRYRGWDLRSYFLANLGGCGVEQVARAFGWPSLLRPGLLLDVTLPKLLTPLAEKSAASWQAKLQGGGQRSEVGGSADLRPPTSDIRSSAQLANLRRLRRKIAKLAAGYRPRGVWASYTRNCNYTDEAERAKKSLVESFLKETRPRRVLDLGCNTGDYSRLAAECGAEVIAVDSDHDAVEMLYRQLRKEPASIAPMVVDLGNPSPAIGFMNRERSAFVDRARADCVLALALLHHLLVAGNLSLDAICEMFATLSDRDLILEFIPTDDSMFRRLLAFRVNLFESLTLPSAREAFAKRFTLIKEEPILHSQRTLLFFRNESR